MTKSALRTALYVVCGLLLAAAGLAAIFGCTLGAVLRLAVPGLVLLFGLLVEPWRYKPVAARSPGPDWVPTKERFVDPKSGKLITVFYQPSSGERCYVADDRGRL